MTDSSHGSGHGAPWAPRPAAGPPRNGTGIAALVLGLLAVVFFWTVVGGILLGLVAVILGVIGLRRKGRGEATNGVMPVIGIVAGALGLVASAVILAVGISLVGSDEFDNLRDCLDKADTVAEQQQCEEDFVDEVLP